MEGNLKTNGYTTIEATIIIPMTILITMLLVWLGVFFFNKNIMAHAASRAAIMGGQHPELSNDDLVEYVTLTAEDIMKNKLLFMEDPVIEVTVNYMDIVVHISGDMRLPDSTRMGGIYTERIWEIDLTEKGARLDPSIFVRTIGRVRNGLSENRVSASE